MVYVCNMFHHNSLGIPQQLIQIVRKYLKDQTLVVSEDKVVEQFYEVFLVTQVFLVDLA